MLGQVAGMGEGATSISRARGGSGAPDIPQVAGVVLRSRAMQGEEMRGEEMRCRAMQGEAR